MESFTAKKSVAEENSAENSITNDPASMEIIETSESRVKTPKISPLVIYTHIKDHQKTLQEMQKDLTEKLIISCKRDRMVIYTKYESDYKKMREKIKAANVPYHTCSLGSEKPIVSIL